VLGALRQPLPVVLVSAHALGNELLEHLGDNVFEFLRKPVPPHRLLQAVAAAAEWGGRSER
jgi:DNA-binding NtrC family response regulator